MPATRFRRWSLSGSDFLTSQPSGRGERIGNKMVDKKTTEQAILDQLAAIPLELKQLRTTQLVFLEKTTRTSSSREVRVPSFSEALAKSCEWSLSY